MRWFRCAFLCAAMHSVAMAAPVLSVEPARPVVEVGQPISLNLVVTGITDLFAFQFDIGFDPAVLNARAVAEGPFLASGGATAFIPGTIDNTAGTVKFTANTLLGTVPGVTGSGVLATVDLIAVHAGTSAVNMSDPNLLDSTLFDINVTTHPATVVAIPEPQAVSLAVIGLGVLVAAIGKRRC